MKNLTDEIKTSLEGPPAVFWVPALWTPLCRFSLFSRLNYWHITQQSFNAMKLPGGMVLVTHETTEKFSLQLMSAFLAQNIFFLQEKFPSPCPAPLNPQDFLE